MNGPMPFGSTEQVQKNLDHVRTCDWCMKRAKRTDPALLPASLLKQIGGNSAKSTRTVQDNMNTRKELKRTEKALKAFGTGVSLAGAGSTAADRQSTADLAAMVRTAATTQTRQVHNRVSQVFDDRVNAAKSALSRSNDEYETARAKTALADALKSRCMAKMVVRDNAQANRQIPPARFGPNSTDLFGGTSLTLPEDRAVSGI